MNETKHTPAPWKIRDRTGTVGNPSMQIEGPQGEVVARIIYQDGFGTLQANTNLISAAPELLKLLKDCHNVLFQFPDYQEGNLCDDVKSAIAKAEGSAQ